MTCDRSVEWRVEAIHLQQVVDAQRRAILTLRGRLEETQRAVEHLEAEWRELLGLCARAGFSPFASENAEGR